MKMQRIGALTLAVAFCFLIASPPASADSHDRKILRSISPDSRTALQPGIEAIEKGDYKTALEFFLDAVTLDPANDDALYLAGIYYNRLGMHHFAAVTLEQLLRSRGNDLDVRYELAIAYSQLGCFQDAAEEYRTITRLDPGDIEAYYRMSYAYSRLDWHSMAAAAFKELVYAVCESSPDGNSRCSGADGRLDKMIDTYRRYIWTDNGEADIHYQRGIAWLILARTDLALNEYRRLKPRNSYQASALYRLIKR